METISEPGRFRFVSNFTGLEQAVRSEFGRRLRLATVYLKTKVQRNLSTPTRSAGPSAPGEYPHAYTRHLRRSIFESVDEEAMEGKVGTPLCIFGPHTRVSVKDKRATVPICQIKAGDLVLTQTGDYHKVLSVHKWPAMQKPLLTDIVFQRGRDRVGRIPSTNKITVTQDHEILVCRDGVNKWIAAGLLTTDDSVYVKVRAVHCKVKTKFAKRFCINCGKRIKRYAIKGKKKYKFCTPQCRAAYWKKTDTNPHSGVKRDMFTGVKISIKNKERFARNPELHPNRIMAARGHMTSPEKTMEEWLIDRGLSFEKQVKTDSSFSDFYVKSENTLYEADGGYWHQDQSKDIERDKTILANRPGIQILHVHFYDKRYSPKNLDPNPLPGVHYVKCNPGTDTFIDPRVFEKRPIKLVRNWNYADVPLKPHGSKSAAVVYDLTVEGVHSFLANNAIVSNSYGLALEMGATIRPVQAMALSIPISDEARQISSRGQGPRDFPRPLRIQPRQGQPPLLVEDLPGRGRGPGRMVPHYVLVPEVTLAPRPFLRRTLVEELAALEAIFTKPMPRLGLGIEGTVEVG